MRDRYTYFLRIADDVSKGSTCLRAHWGAVLVDPQDRIISTGYNGAPKKTINCCDTGVCRRQQMDVPSGKQVELCYAVHAEMNALLQAGPKAEGATLYLSGRSPEGELLAGFGGCILCAKQLINAEVALTVEARGPRGEEPFVTTPRESLYARALKQGLHIPNELRARFLRCYDGQGRIDNGYYETLFWEDSHGQKDQT